MPIPNNFPKVPIVGLKKPEVRIHYTAVQMVVSCDCGSDVPVVIPGGDRAGLCQACKTKYVIARMVYENKDGMVSLDAQAGKWNGPMAASFDLDLPKVALNETH